MQLSKEQINAIKHTEGPCLVLAVPGAGKTTVILNRVRYLVEQMGIKAEKILSITFSKAQALDMEMRFKNFASYYAKFSTIHSLAFSVLRDYAKKKKINYKLIESTKNPINKYSIIRDIVRNITNEFVTEELTENLFNAIGYVKNSMTEPIDFCENNEIIPHFPEIFKEYEKIKRENHLIDFDDMLTLTDEIFEKDSEILNKYRTKYEYIQLDEGQDTSTVQVKIIKNLVYPKNNLFVVADDDQSIYGFRGADSKWLLNYKKSYPNADFFFIEENYRSQKTIVDNMNKFISKNKLRYKKIVKTQKSASLPIAIVKPKDLSEEYRYIVKQIKNNLHNTAILYRNNISAVGLIDIFEQENIPFKLRDTKLRFFRNKVLFDIRAFFDFANDMRNIEAFEKIFYKMKGYISRKQVNFAKNSSPDLPVLERILDYPDLPNFYKENIFELQYDFNKLQKLNIPEALDWIEYSLDYKRYLKDNSNTSNISSNTSELIFYYLKLIAKNAKTYSDLKNRLDFLEKLSIKSHNNDGVILSTIHGAKGLEFDKVFVIDLFEGVLPNSEAIGEMHHGNFIPLEEERRLFYVAMSRAKSSLTLIAPKNIGSDKLRQSVFFDELLIKDKDINK